MYLLPLTIIIAIAVVDLQWATSFIPPLLFTKHIQKGSQNVHCDHILSNNRRFRNNCLFVEPKIDSQDESADITESTSNKSLVLPPSLPPTKEDEKGKAIDKRSSEIEIVPSSTTTLFINQKIKRVLIEELGYKRAEVERLRPELAAPIVTKRIARPREGVPGEWILPEEEKTDSMLQKLEQEQKYPLKVPLLGISLILFGKGFSDALITFIKIYIDFPGADLLVKEQFMGLPVLGIDFGCVLIGASLGYWTWNTMKN